MVRASDWQLKRRFGDKISVNIDGMLSLVDFSDFMQ